MSPVLSMKHRGVRVGLRLQKDACFAWAFLGVFSFGSSNTKNLRAHGSVWDT